MRSVTFLFVFFGVFDLVGAYNVGNKRERIGSHRFWEGRADQEDQRQSPPNMMIPGDRVSAMDKDSAKCLTNPHPDREVAIKRTVVEYYYAIESTEKITTNEYSGRRSMVLALEENLFHEIKPALLWCYYDEVPFTRRNLRSYPSISLQEGDHSEEGNVVRKLRLEDARRLSIVSFSNSPDDQETSIDCNFPRQDDLNCVVMHGMMTILHHETSDVSLAVASIYDSTQKAMDYSEVFFDLENEGIFNITWLGETENDAKNGGPNGNDIIVVSGSVVRGQDIDVPVAIITEVSEQEDNEGSLLAFALAVPILILLASALLLTKRKRKVRTREELFSARSAGTNLIGTGDPPNSFHEGMYHYTNDGTRYLSTNCAVCIETKKMGFFTEGDLDTIAEHSVEEDDRSAHRNKFFVSPSTNALATKHSSINVHNCTSANCPICTHKPRDVEFISKSDGFKTSRPGESEE